MGGLAEAMSSVGAQKSLGFLTLMIFGRLTKSRFPAARVAGIQQMILDLMLPCVIFKALSSIKLSAQVIKWPLLGTACVAFELIMLSLVGAVVFPGKQLGAARRSSVYQLATMAPGLSAIVFVKEFVGTEAAGYAALFDLPSKLYMIFLLPRLLSYSSEPGSSKSKAQTASFLKLLEDPLNVAIAGGLLMAATGCPYAQLGPLGSAIDSLAAAQTPTLFVLVGMKLKLSGTTPAACGVLLAARHAVMYAFHVLAMRVVDLTEAEQLTLLLLCQAAVSVIGWSQISKIVDAGAKGFNPEFAFDIVGFSMPLSMLLQTIACLADTGSVLAAIPVAAPVLAAASLVSFLAIKSKLQDPAAWTTNNSQKLT